MKTLIFLLCIAWSAAGWGQEGLVTLPGGSEGTPWTEGQLRSIKYLMGIPGLDKLKPGDYELSISDYLEADPESGFAVPQIQFELIINKDFRIYEVHGRKGTKITGLGGVWGGPEMRISGESAALWKGKEIAVSSMDIDTGNPREARTLKDVVINGVRLPKLTSINFRRHRGPLTSEFPPIVCLQGKEDMTIQGTHVWKRRLVHIDDAGKLQLEFNENTCLYTPPDIVEPPATEAPCVNCDHTGKSSDKEGLDENGKLLWRAGETKNFDSVRKAPGLRELSPEDYVLAYSQISSLKKIRLGSSFPDIRYVVSVKKDFRFYDLQRPKGSLIFVAGPDGKEQVLFGAESIKYGGAEFGGTAVFDVDNGNPRSLQLMKDAKINGLKLPKGATLYFGRHEKRISQGFPPIRCIHVDQDTKILGTVLPKGSLGLISNGKIIHKDFSPGNCTK
ncbi:MAG: hypothetical protein H6624_11425 [Bdellovibrionaceae bacterium]|nr:hypothetical protein [Bdellovibrionales bacterium]MCB9084949.1 hypothetical protein [Pseudobdellovibrionaceae bacterium]